jgi:hypothetical protein
VPCAWTGIFGQFSWLRLPQMVWEVRKGGCIWASFRLPFRVLSGLVLFNAIAMNRGLGIASTTDSRSLVRRPPWKEEGEMEGEHRIPVSQRPGETLLTILESPPAAWSEWAPDSGRSRRTWNGHARVACHIDRRRR